MRSTAFIPLLAFAIGMTLAVPLPWVIGGMGRYRDQTWPAYRRSYHVMAGLYGGLAVVFGAGAVLAWYV